jgi:hypothetical protein
MTFLKYIEKTLLYCAIAIGVPILWAIMLFLIPITFLIQLFTGKKFERIDHRFMRLKALLPGDTPHPEPGEICFAMLDENLFYDECEMAFYDLVYIADAHYREQTPIDSIFCAEARKLGEEMLADNPDRYIKNDFIKLALDMLAEIESSHGIT